MKQFLRKGDAPKEKKASVAWFKLAELISRGEKEKALNLYRLLAHSFEERAYALQVEGDILWSFDDNGAIERYKNAAFLYHKEKNIVAAVGVYEHLFELESEKVVYLIHLLKLYSQLHWTEKFRDRFNVLMEKLEREEVSLASVQEVMEDVSKILKSKTGDDDDDRKDDIFHIISEQLEKSV
jgi:hypothetical protein